MGINRNVEHPGYIVHEIAGMFYPVHLDGGALPQYAGMGYGGAKDDKGRSVSNVVRTWGDHGYGNPFMHENGNLVWFDNAPHAHNFLGKWVREQVGLVRAAEIWGDYQKKQANRVADLPNLLDSLEAKRDKYRTLAGAFDAARELVRIIDEGRMDKEIARQIFETVVEQSAYEEVRELYRDLSARI